MKQALLPSGHALVERLTAHYRHAPRYEEAARCYVEALADTVMPPQTPLVVVHWRRGSLFLNDHPHQRQWSLSRTTANAQRHLRGRASDEAVAGTAHPAVYVVWGGISPKKSRHSTTSR